MIRANTCLWLLLVVCVYIRQNFAATKVFYEFHIREVPNKGTNSDALNNSDYIQADPKVLITGTHTSSVVLHGKDSNSSDNVYKETAVYTKDDSGYHVEYNISIAPLELGPRLNGKTLSVLTG